MFARIVTMRLKPNSAAEFTQTIEKKVLPILRKQQGFRDGLFFVASEGAEAVGISLWDKKEQAEAYQKSTYSQILKEMANVTEGTPRVQTYDVANSTPHNIGSKAA